MSERENNKHNAIRVFNQRFTGGASVPRLNGFGEGFDAGYSSADTLAPVLRDFYAWEINVSISSFWDGGWQVKIGDETNGFTDVANFDDDDFGAITEHLREKLNEIKRLAKYEEGDER